MNNKDYKKIGKEIKKEILQSKKVDDDIKILMPFQIAIMRTDMSKVQQNVILSILDKIKDKLYSVKNNQINKGDELSLFSADELDTDNHAVKMKFMFKDFGVSSSNYFHLKNALEMMSTVPVQIPFKGADGIDYYKHTNFCDVYIPQNTNYNKHCFISIDNDVAQHILNFDFGHLYIGKSISHKMETKYSERLYWYIKAHAFAGGHTISLTDFREMLGLAGKYKSFSMLEEKVIKKSQVEIKDKFDKGGIECYFTVDYKYNNGKKRGTPSFLIFTIYSSQQTINENLDKLKYIEVDDIYDKLKDELNIPEPMVKLLLKSVTDENINDLRLKIASIKISLENDSSIKNPTAYAVQAVKNFFDEFNNNSSIAKTPEDYRKIWISIVEQMGKERSEDFMNSTFSHVFFDSYDEEKKALMLSVVGEDVYKNIENNETEYLTKWLRKYYDFKTFHWRLFRTQEAYNAEVNNK